MAKNIGELEKMSQWCIWKKNKLPLSNFHCYSLWNLMCSVIIDDIRRVLMITLSFSWQMVYCSLTDFQKAVYQTVLETEDVALILQSPQPCTCGSGRKRRNCCYKASIAEHLCSLVLMTWYSVLLSGRVAGKIRFPQGSSLMV